ncbi:GNAT family N-acetyltransferase [Chryseobacterium sp. G0162]|uniref:GNAT family N-acetyltransferase n=1 Tax=Chryseobacterium sp. G0162 TaxID=2487063 RepID=UPI001E31049A|nr:GNAT family N-acetyltransferase [Chryseobacterium sp. G0162]
MMEEPLITANGISIRTTINPGDLGYIMYRHGKLYGKEYNYGVSFETYVGYGLYEFYKNYDPLLDRVWICEKNDKIVGFLLLMHRENQTAQLRYFYLDEETRGLGLGNQLMLALVEFAKEKKYKSVYLWTTDDLLAAHHLYKKYGFRLTEEKPSTEFGKSLKEQRYDLMLI